MLQKSILLLLLLTVSRTLISCCKEGYDFRWTDAKLKNMRVDNNSFTSLLTDSSQIANYGLQLSFDHEKVVSRGFEHGGIGEAIALSCNEQYVNRDTLIKLDLLTLNAFDATHPAGSSLNDLRIVQLWGAFDTTSNPLRSLSNPSLLHDLNGTTGGYASFNPSRSLLFFIKNTTPFRGQHRFKTVATLASGKTLEDNVQVRLY